MNLSAWLQGASPSEADVRAEIWRLGARHHGRPLEGAIQDLKAPDLPPRQSVLLRACVRKLKRDQAAARAGR